MPTSQGINSGAQIFSFLRVYEHEKKKEIILVCVNMDLHSKADLIPIYLDDDSGIDFSKKYILKDLLTNKKYVREGKEISVILEPGESHIFQVMQE